MAKRKMVKPAKKADPHGTNGGNGAYSKRQSLTNSPNRQKMHHDPYDYHGNNMGRGSGKKL